MELTGLEHLDTLSYKELCSIETRISKLKVDQKKKETRELAKKIKELVSESGGSLEDLIPELSRQAEEPKNKRVKTAYTVAPKYQNPQNEAQTWSGRGRMPLWVKPYHEQARLAEIEIKQQVTPAQEPIQEPVKAVKKKGKEAEK